VWKKWGSNLSLTILFFRMTPKYYLLPGPSTHFFIWFSMGGKSTLLRQSCIAIILAQIGSYVPAKSFNLTPMVKNNYMT
jgi:hypothetical protein